MHGVQNVAAEDTNPAGESENRYQSAAAAKHDGRPVKKKHGRGKRRAFLLIV